MGWPYIRVRGGRTGPGDGGYYIQIAEFQILDPGGTNVAVGGAGSTDSQYPSATWDVSKAFDGDAATAWLSGVGVQGSETWIQYYLPAGMEASAVRLLPYPPYENRGFSNAVVEGSADGVTWVILAKGVTMAPTAAWTTHPLSGGASVRVPLQAILNALPASLARGFR